MMYVEVLGQKLAYKVFRIQVVLPTVSSLKVEGGAGPVDGADLHLTGLIPTACWRRASASLAEADFES